MEEESAPRPARGGRPKGDPAAVRAAIIGVRVSPGEEEEIKIKAAEMGMAVGTWLREAALSRRLPSPPVPLVNRQEYAELARLAGNLNQLARSANSGRPVTVTDALLHGLTAEVGRLRLALLGEGRE